MRRGPLSALLLVLGLAAGCGSSPAPGPSVASISATESTITAALAQALSQAAVFGPGGTITNPMVMPCPDGGSITVTHSGPLPPDFGGKFVTTSKTEFNDCKTQNVIIRGDPWLQIAGEYVFGPPGGGTPSSVSSTMSITGGLRSEANGVHGRAQYNCTMTFAVQYAGNGQPPQITTTATGTITWEQPLGTPVRTSACGPPR